MGAYKKVKIKGLTETQGGGGGYSLCKQFWYGIYSIKRRAFIKFFVIRVRRLFEGGVYLKSNLFLANETVHCENSGEGA